MAVGRIVYTQMLNARGGIESDLTVTRLVRDRLPAGRPGGDAAARPELAAAAPGRGVAVVVTDVSAGEAVLPVMGPRSRDLLGRVSPDDLSNAGFPFGTAREIEIGMGLARAHRVSYVGELGWELYVSAEQAAHVFETLVEAGAGLGLRLCGLHAMDSCRIEKGYRHFGHDITDEDHVLEAGLGFAVEAGARATSSAATRCCAGARCGPHAAAAAVPARATRSRCSSTASRSCATAGSSGT